MDNIKKWIEDAIVQIQRLMAQADSTAGDELAHRLELLARAAALMQGGDSELAHRLLLMAMKGVPTDGPLASESLSSGQGMPYPVPLSAELLEWARREFNEEEIVAGLREIRETGGLQFEDFLPELEQIVNPDD